MSPWKAVGRVHTKPHHGRGAGHVRSNVEPRWRSGRKCGAGPSGSPLSGDDYSDVAQAFRTKHRIHSSASIDGTEYARVAIPFTNRINPNQRSVRYVLAVRKSIGEIPSAVRVITGVSAR